MGRGRRLRAATLARVAAAAGATLALTGTAAGTAGALSRVPPARVRAGLAVFTVHNACGSPRQVNRNYLVVAFEAAELVPGNRYVLVATWPANAGRFPFLFEFVARRNTYATRGVRLHPFVADDPIPRTAFVAHLALDNLGPSDGSVGITPSNPVESPVAACP